MSGLCFFFFFFVDMYFLGDFIVFSQVKRTFFEQTELSLFSFLLKNYHEFFHKVRLMMR